MIKPETYAALLPYQLDALEWMLPREWSHLHASAGSGKTLMSLVWAFGGTGYDSRKKVLVATPSAVKRQWYSEIKRWTNAEAQILQGVKELTPIDPSKHIYLIGYEILHAHVNQLIPLVHTVIWDESQFVKSWRRWKAIPDPQNPLNKPRFELLGNMASSAMQIGHKAKRRLAMTATPIADRLRDLWAQLDLIEPRKWGTFGSFAKAYCDAKPTDWSRLDTSGEGTEEQLTELLERLDPIRYEISKAVANANLPPKRRTVIRVPVSEQVRAPESRADLKAAAKMGVHMLREALIRDAAGRKRKVLCDLVSDALEHNFKVIVFTGRRKDCDVLADQLRKVTKGKVPVWSGHGGHSESTRDQIHRDYMSHQGACALIGTTDAWGTGLNLQDTDILYVAMLPWTPKQVIQAEGRVSRQGQQRPVTVCYIIAEGTIDENLARTLIDKLPIVEKVVDGSELDGLYTELQGGTDEELLAQLAQGYE